MSLQKLHIELKTKLQWYSQGRLTTVYQYVEKTCNYQIIYIIYLISS